MLVNAGASRPVDVRSPHELASSMVPPRLLALASRASGLPRSLGPATVTRALLDTGTDPRRATASDYARALPKLRERLLAHMSPQAADIASDAIAIALDLPLDAERVQFVARWLPPR